MDAAAHATGESSVEGELSVEREDVPSSRWPGRPSRELVTPDIASAIRWHRHDFPHPLARWHSHPEVEIHLITQSVGNAFVGDYVGRFAPGHLVVVGSDLPHNWISDLHAGERVRGRDIVLQIHPDRVRRLAEAAPEALEALAYFSSVARGVEYTGETARVVGAQLTAIGDTTGLTRLARLFALLEALRDAPADERVVLSTTSREEGPESGVNERIDAVLSYITAHLHGDVTLAEAARIVAMTPSSLSRFFRANAGRGFAQTVRRLRVIRACELLWESTDTVLGISQRVGYHNLSNFNRQFRAEMGLTPREYRAQRPGRGDTPHSSRRREGG